MLGLSPAPQEPLAGRVNASELSDPSAVPGANGSLSALALPGSPGHGGPLSNRFDSPSSWHPMATHRNSSDGAVLVAVRKQMAALESRLGGQLASFARQSESLRHAAFTRVDSKLGTMEQRQPVLEHRLAELCGNFKGLSDEMQVQIRRVEDMETRLWSWQRQFEDEIRARLSEMDRRHQEENVALRLTASSNDALVKTLEHRIKPLEDEGGHGFMLDDSVVLSIENLEARIAGLEAVCGENLPLTAVANIVSENPGRGENSGDLFFEFESSFRDLSKRVVQCVESVQEMRSSLEAHEESFRVAQTKMDGKEEQMRASKQSDREWLETRLRELEDRLQELDKHRAAHGERLELWDARLDRLDTHSQDMSDQLIKLREIETHDGSCEGRSNQVQVIDKISESLTLPQAQPASEAADFDESLVAPNRTLIDRVQVVMDTFTSIAPMIASHEAEISRFYEGMGYIQAKVEDVAAGNDAVRSRMSKLEAETWRFIGVAASPPLSPRSPRLPDVEPAKEPTEKVAGQAEFQSGLGH